tara:strand:- start:1405 stop:1821 length:417 start_codon:yes stop_codon:yes gene_type:complete
MSEDQTDQKNSNVVLIALGVIASVKKNDLLTWDASGNPNIQVYGPFRSIRRTMTKQNRQSTIYHLNRIIYTAICMYEDLDHDMWIAIRLKQSLQECTYGLKNLMNTYGNDILIVQALALLHADILNIDNTNASFHETF